MTDGSVIGRERADCRVNRPEEIHRQGELSKLIPLKDLLNADISRRLDGLRVQGRKEPSMASTRSLLAALVLVTVAAVAAPQTAHAQFPHILALDAPAPTAPGEPIVVTQNFEITGFAWGYDAVHVWAWASPWEAMFIGHATPPNGFDLKRGIPDGHFRIVGVYVPVGTYLLTINARNKDTQLFDTWIVKQITVVPCVWSTSEVEEVMTPTGPLRGTWTACR
jgi:hypothetical protein